MSRIILAGLLAVSTFAMTSPEASASRRGVAIATRAITGRTVRSYQRDVRQFQRTTSRSFNQLNRGFSRSIRQAPRVRTVAPRSSGVYLGGPRAGFYFSF